MIEKKKNKPAATTRMSTDERAGFSLASSPRFKTIAAKVDKGELTTAEAIDMLVPKDLKGEERKKVRKKIAQAIGSQTAKQFITQTRQEVSEKVNRPRGIHEKKQTRKPSFNKGGYANCGASMKPTQKSSQGIA